MNLTFKRHARTILSVILVAVSAVGPAHAQFNISDVFAPLRPSASGSYLAGSKALDDLRTEEAASFLSAAAQAEWENPILVERAFVALAADGQIERAAGMARHLLELQPGNQLAQLVIATQALKERRYGAVERMLSGISQDSFSGITAGILRAWALIGDKRVGEADVLMEKLGRSGLEDFLVFHRALMAENAGNMARALEFADRSFSAEPFVARMAEVYARMLANEGRFDEATDVIAEFEGQGVTHPVVTVVKDLVAQGKRPGPFAANVQIGAAEMFHGIGVALSRDGSVDLSMVFLRLGTYLDPSADVIALAVGQLLDQNGQREAANRIYDAIPSGSPMKPSALVRVAQNLDALGDREEALRRLRNMVAAAPDDIDAVSVLGDLLRFDEQYVESAEAYGKALELSGGEAASDWRYYYLRGIAYERAKMWPEAEADFLKALELNPDQPQVLNYLGYSWIDMDMHLERALEMIETAVEAQPRDGYIIDSLGWAFYKLGRIDEAVETLERAVMLLPNDPEINDHLGDAYWKAGRKLEARFQWNVAKSVDAVGTVAERVTPKLVDGLTPENATE